MSDPQTDKESGFLGIRSWVWGFSILSLIALGIFVTMDDQAPVTTSEATPEPVDSSESKDQWESAFPPDPPDEKIPKEKKKAPPTSSEMEYAIPTFAFESQLTVILASHPELGEISVERYDSEGNPTGEPLKQGTQVQIPNPSRPGEKIYFKVP